MSILPRSAMFSPRLQAAQIGTDGTIRFALYAVVGAAVGALVALLEWITIELVLHELLAAPTWLQALVPGVGLVLVAGVFWWASRSEPLSAATSDAYVESFHSGDGPEPRELPAKLVASFLTLGSGGAVGLEGPAILAGSTIGRALAKLSPKSLGDRGTRGLLVAGAAAGVAAVFKAPATGVLFALETPYRRDIARHALIPALISSAASYITFVLLLGGDPLLRFAPTEVTITDEIIGAIALGIVGGATARMLAKLFAWAKGRSYHLELKYRLPLSTVVSAGCLLLAATLVDLPVTLGPGAEMIAEIVVDPAVGLGALLALFVLRSVATSATMSAGGIGGVFIPLVVQGLLLGRMVEIILDVPPTGLYPVIGLAAVLGAAYRTPLAAVVFVAESTGRAEFVIPALIATAIAQSLMGDVSVSSGQINERQGQLERRLSAPAHLVMITDIGVVAPDDSLLHVIDRYGDLPSTPAVPVAGPDYVGLLVLHDLATVMLEKGVDVTAADAMREIPSISSTEPAVEAARRMNEYDTAAVAVVDESGRPLGVISALSLAGLRDVR